MPCRFPQPAVVLDAFGAGDFDQDPATDFIGIQVAAVSEDHDAELPAGHHSDIGRCIVEAAVLLDDDRLRA